MLHDRPNILVLMTDQHSKHALGCYGNDLVRTPNLDRLAQEGMRFDSCYCPSPVCVPSRMSFLTARHAYRNRVWDNHQLLPSGIPTWAHTLGLAGYDTALIGRMHFQGPDQHHGFRERPIGEFSTGEPGELYKGGPSFTVYPRHTTGQCREAVEIAGRGVGSYSGWTSASPKRPAPTCCAGRARETAGPLPPL